MARSRGLGDVYKRQPLLPVTNILINPKLISCVYAVI
jgi:hypothetical protein